MPATPAQPAGAREPHRPLAKPADAATVNAGMTAPAGVAVPEGNAAEAESILQVMGPRLPQAAAAAPTPAAPAAIPPVAANEPAPLRILRENAPVSPAAATGDGLAMGVAAGAAANSGGARTGSGDLGFKTDLGTVFAALSASGETADPVDFRNLVTGQTARAAAVEMPAAEPRTAPPAPATAAANTALAAAPPTLATASAEPVHHATTPRHAPVLPAAPATLQISVQMIRAIGEGVSRIHVDLTPAELGRVEVRIELGSDGRVQGTVTADRQDTFDMLQRDSRALERALQDAGLKTDSQSLSFNLRGEGQQGRTAPEKPVHETYGSNSLTEDPPPPPPPPRPASIPVGAVDIRV